MFGDPEGPTQLGRRRERIRVGELSNRVCGDTGHFGCSVQCPCIDGGLVIVESDGCTFDELTIMQAGADDLAPDCIGKGDVGSNVETKPEIGERRGRAAPGIDDDEFRAVTDALEEMMKEDRVCITRVGTPQDDEVRFLSFLVGTRSATCSEYRRQTGDTGSVSGTVTRVDRVGPNGDTDELLCKVVHLVRAFGTTHHPERSRAVLPGDGLDTAGCSVERLVPRCRSQNPIFPDERAGEPISMHAHTSFQRQLRVWRPFDPSL